MDVRAVDIANANTLLREICSSGGLTFRDLKNATGLLQPDMMSALRVLFGPDYIVKTDGAGSSSYKYTATPAGMAAFQRGGLSTDIDKYNRTVTENKQRAGQASFQYLWMGSDDDWKSDDVEAYNLGKSFSELSINIMLERYKPIPILTSLFHDANLVSTGAWEAYIIRGEFSGHKNDKGQPILTNCVKEKNISDLFRDQGYSASNNDLLSAFDSLDTFQNMKDFGAAVDSTLDGLLGSSSDKGTVFSDSEFVELPDAFDDDIPF